MRPAPLALADPLTAEPPAPERVTDAASLREWRARLGLIRQQAADILGVSIHTIQQWEDGNRRAGGLPLWLGKLCAYHERYGDI